MGALALECARTELIAENALLRQQLIVASERGLLVLLVSIGQVARGFARNRHCSRAVVDFSASSLAGRRACRVNLQRLQAARR
jgi:hypothetical protein